MKNVRNLCLLVLSLVLLTGCEKTMLDEQSSKQDGNVVLKLSLYEQIPFSTRSLQDIRQLCTRVNVAFFKTARR